MKFLGHVPINLTIREHGDEGTPAVVADDTPDVVREAFRGIAQQTAAALATRNHEGSKQAPLELS